MIPPAITGGSARFISREIQAGARSHSPFFSTTLKAAIAPFLTGPYAIGALNFECFGPQNGVNTQRVPFESSQLAIDPQTPAEAKLTSSLQISGVRCNGVRWSSPPIDSVSIR